MPETVRAQLVRRPKTPEERAQTGARTKKAGVDGIKAILEAGLGDGMRLRPPGSADRARVAEEAHAQNLPLAVHTGDARDVTDAVEIGATRWSTAPGATKFPTTCWRAWPREGVYLDPTLAVAEAYAQYFGGKADALNNSLVQQVVPAGMLKGTREFVHPARARTPAGRRCSPQALEQARANLLRAWKAGVPLVMGTDSGNPLVFPGPSMHHELQLWVEAGIPAGVALQAATVNAAKLLRADNRSAPSARAWTPTCCWWTATR